MTITTAPQVNIESRKFLKKFSRYNFKPQPQSVWRGVFYLPKILNFQTPFTFSLPTLSTPHPPPFPVYSGVSMASSTGHNSEKESPSATSAEKPFVHLHCHSDYSLLDGLSKIPDLVHRAKELGMTALALTDHGTMYGALDFYKACKKEDIKPIVGVEVYMAERSRHDKESGIDNKRYHLTLLAKNVMGYKNLVKLVSKAALEGFYYKPRIDEELLGLHHEGLICLTGCPGSRFIQALKSNDLTEAKRLLNFYIHTFGKEHVFIEVMKHEEVDWYIPLIPTLQILADEFDLPLVATWDSHYLLPEDKIAHNTLLAINTNNTEFKMEGDYSLISANQAYEVFKDIPHAVANTQKVADLVDIEINIDEWYFPNFPIPEGSTFDGELRALAHAGIAMRNLEKTPELEKRISYELEIISMKGYPAYFLCMADFTQFAKEKGILVNTRGSAAGSMVSYLCGITNINPMQFNLPFERFLNPERPSLPDIDLDIADDRRDEIIDYARQKYGEQAVAQVGTFGKMLARGVVRDVARALGYPYDVGDRLAKMIPMGSQGFAMTITRAMDMVPELLDAYTNETDTREIIDIAKKLEGCARHISVHAAGVVISNTGNVTDFSPVQLDPKGGKIITQYNMYSGLNKENVIGMPKFDFLGIRNLTILADSIERVKKIRNIIIDIDTIPLDDALTFAMMSRGDTLGVFQFAGDGMTRWVKELEPSVIDDLIAMVALYRPGPMEFIPEYIKRKHNPETVTYIDPRLEPILKSTYGIIIYQDDILLIVNQLAGYTLGQADMFRRAIGKKKPEEMEKQHALFIKGCIDNDMREDVAKELWDMIETFAAYGFNKAHAASYGQLSYRTAYMKAHYPAEYLTAIMSAESGNIEKVAEVVETARHIGFTILPPDINESFSDFTVVVSADAEPEITPEITPLHPVGNRTPDGRLITNNIRFGLRNIKNFGDEIGKVIIRERKTHGPYTSLENFLERVQHRNVTKKSLEALIMSGAMDRFGERGHLLGNVENLLSYNRQVKPENATQNSLFADLSSRPAGRLILDACAPAKMTQKLLWEKELLGLYISGHPLDMYKPQLDRVGTNIIKAKKGMRADQVVFLAGLVESVREIITKKNTKMAFIKFSDLTDTMEAVIFPDNFREYKRLLKPDALLVFKGKLSDRNGERSLIVDEIKELES